VPKAGSSGPDIWINVVVLIAGGALTELSIEPFSSAAAAFAKPARHNVPTDTLGKSHRLQDINTLR
jgi:hypothetical protein